MEINLPLFVDNRAVVLSKLIGLEHLDIPHVYLFVSFSFSFFFMESFFI
jgi:hypothetical protein